MANFVRQRQEMVIEKDRASRQRVILRDTRELGKSGSHVGRLGTLIEVLVCVLASEIDPRYARGLTYVSCPTVTRRSNSEDMGDRHCGGEGDARQRREGVYSAVGNRVLTRAAIIFRGSRFGSPSVRTIVDPRLRGFGSTGAGA